VARRVGTSRGLRVLALRLIAACAFATWGATAAAQPSLADAATAQTLFDEGKKLMVDHRYAEACPKLAESNRLDQGLGTILFLGACYEKTGALASAWATFRDAADLAHKLGDNREGVAREYVARLDPSLYKLTIVVPPAVAAIAGLEVRRDGAIVAVPAWGSPVPVDPGTHVISAEAPDRAPWRQSIDAPATGGATTVAVPVLGAAPRTVVPTPPSPEDATGRSQRIVGVVLAGVGLAAGGALGTIFGLDAKAKNDQANANGRCVDTTCVDGGGVDLRHRALTSALVSDVAFVAGGALVAAGVVVLLTAPSPRGAVRAAVAPGFVALEGTWF
jgi:hypothetical protein